MRPIKFRAWDGKKMIHYTLDDLLWVLSGSGTISPYPEKQHLRDLMNAWEGDNSEAMKQVFTGLNDMNGREIFQGDALQYERPTSKSLPCRVVGFEDGGFGYKNADDVWVSLGGMARLMRVVGNIHENPELLEKKP